MQKNIPHRSPMAGIFYFADSQPLRRIIQHEDFFGEAFLNFHSYVLKFPRLTKNIFTPTFVAQT